MQPTIVLTRPKAQSAAFADALVAARGVALPILIAPLMRIDPVTPPDFGKPDHIIFTSVNGVDQAKELGVPISTTAWCVGDQTAQAAACYGFEVHNAKGNSDDLVTLMTAAKPRGQIVHFHGAHVAGRIAERLTDAGLTCEGRVVYAQVDENPPDALRAAFDQTAHLIVPVFSPRSAKLLAQTLPHHAPISLIAISAGVAEVCKMIPSVEVVTSEFPDKKSMIAATLDVFAALCLRKTT